MAIYTNMYLLVFLPLVLIIYQLAPRKVRWGDLRIHMVDRKTDGRAE